MKIKRMSAEEFWPLLKKNSPKVFKTQIFSAADYMSVDQRSGFSDRKKFLKDQINLFYGLFDEKDHFVGWSNGFQLKPNEFYMMSSAVLPKYRRKGWYTKLAKTMIQEVERLGFLVVHSNHLATNNPVIIAKLKMGFVVSGIEISEQMGTLLKLSYFMNPLTHEVMKYRTGEMKPSARVKKALKLR